MASAAGLTHKMSTNVCFLSLKMTEKVIILNTVKGMRLMTELTEVLGADPDGEVLLGLL